MNPLFDIETFKTKKGLYESFYFRGNHSDGNRAFWLKHNLIRFNNSPEVRFDNIFIEFDKRSSKPPQVFSQSRILTSKEIDRFQKTNWNQFTLEFPSGGFVSVQDARLKGKIDEFTWDFKLKRSNTSYFHFDQKWFYTGFFPKKKILTCDTLLEFQDENRGSFKGMNGHNWGTEHAYIYAYANCNQFTDIEGKPVDAYFDGFSAKIKIGPWVSPFLSLGGLFYKNKWYKFNQVATSFKNPVKHLDQRNWSATFLGNDAKMVLTILGESTSGNNIPWVKLLYDHPSRRISQVENTKFAKGSIELYEKEHLIAKIESSYFELETLSELKK